MKLLIMIIASILLTANAQVQPLNIASCNRIGKIVDGNGNFIKSVCEIDYPPSSYSGSVALCAQNGMNLIVAEDQVVYSAVIQYVTTRYRNYPCPDGYSPLTNSCGVFLNGQQNLTDGKWYATINGQQKVMDTSFFKLVTNNLTSKSDTGNCMTFSYVSTNSGLMGFNCGYAFYAICEFNNTYKVTPTQTTTPSLTLPPSTCLATNQGKRYQNLAACNSIGTIRNSCGNIVKGVCELNPANVNSYDDSIQACRNAGMDLFTAETKDVYDSFLQYVNGRYGKHPCGSIWSPACGVWVGGKLNGANWDAVKDWATINIQQTLIQNYKWLGSQNPGNCIALKNYNGFYFMQYNCSQPFGEFNGFNFSLDV